MMRDLYAEPVSIYEEMPELCRTETRERISETIRLCLPFADTPEGVRFGRKQKFVAPNYIDVYKRYENGEISKTAAREEIGASTNTFVKMYRELKQDGLI
ncbi:MAG: hypothetical protein IJR59_02970 [Firmicutes bacterium]|nr:hypothetical protein [Bacillota bacterium]